MGMKTNDTESDFQLTGLIHEMKSHRECTPVAWNERAGGVGVPDDVWFRDLSRGGLKSGSAVWSSTRRKRSFRSFLVLLCFLRLRTR